MAPPTARHKPNAPGKFKSDARSLKRKRDVVDHEKLQNLVDELDIKSEFKEFCDLPLSQPTASGLEASHFKTLTDVQSKAVPLALKGKDILGAAKTGSGKTLAFLVPVLENLYRQKWTEFDGLGALIISPTRELAIQIFEVLRKIGRHHTFSAGLIIGGRSLQEEQERLGRMNILVCTPGRMLQHMDQTAAFEVDNLQMLVLDEADRIMDMGFQTAIDAIVEHLPKKRQTLLFSATQTKRVSDLARLSLKDPEYVSVHESAASATPMSLQQFYVLCPLADKLDTLFSFIRSNIKAKIIVFLSSGKQVRFVYESFRHLQPGIPLMHLHGRQKQTTRLEITSKFSASKNSCIFATDVVARGLDFPAVDWVIQLDCPEDADTYIHRVGRTARYERAGKAVLFLDPSEEEGMLKRLEQKKVPIQRTKPREKKQQSIKNQLQNMCFQDPELKYLGQKAFVSYARSIFVQKDKEIYHINKYDLEGYAASMGLPGAPKIKFRKGEDAKKAKNIPRALLSSEEESDDEPKEPKKPEVRTKYDRMFERRNQDVLSGHYSKLIAEDGHDEIDDARKDADDDNDFLSVKRVVSVDESSDDDEASDEGDAIPGAKIIPGVGREAIVIDSKRKEKLMTSKKKLLKLKEKGTKLVFDDEGKPHEMYELEDERDFVRRGPADAQRAKFVELATEKVREADLDDKELAKQKKRERREKKKAKYAEENAGSEDEAPALVEDGDHQDPLELLASLPLADEEDSKPAKRPKKWFEDDSEDEKRKPKKNKRVIETADEPETLEDLEALAAGLLK
ncbi:P-loop containing nucleoside triphosphate hydrolase [Glarea lozoyensis ATCC 20868]|uniref:ATP-dependent RNA helicase n=1 Tax=Glarea lozoyensis (strain ATCC 20868 / MF5171) TaxID=1116229 RepID=S3CEA8_GLAL2|nr:P-loop containing nucleoside triphosphate hydrolase [Glarea lozoyensis ATCC 20868]EPE24320.1 P-loop containing nucleoside triphosphate hydrolase [Glarea lozoyensis ATCC 20868]